MSTTIVTLPTLVTSGLPYFPASAFTGLKIEVKRTDSFETTVSRAASGRRTAVSWRELPISTFEIDFEFLDANDAHIPMSQDGTVHYTEFDTLRGFFNAQHGQLLPFYLRLSDLTRKPSDSFVQGQQIATGDGATTNFQLCRTVGSYLEPLQMPDPAGTVVVYVNGMPQITGVSILTGGIVQFTTAPAAGATISADIPFVYLCEFDTDDGDWDQIAYLLHECQSLKLRTVPQ